MYYIHIKILFEIPVPNNYIRLVHTKNLIELNTRHILQLLRKPAKAVAGSCFYCTVYGNLKLARHKFKSFKISYRDMRIKGVGSKRRY